MTRHDAKHSIVTPADNGVAGRTSSRRSKRRKIAAVLTGGVMLGVGAVVTLASWNDSEYAGGTFTAGTFDLQGSTDGSTFSNHASSSSPAAVTFTSPFSNLTPNDITYGGFAVELAAGTTNNATVALSVAGTTGVVTNLAYTLFTTSTYGCSSSSTAVTTLVNSGTAVSAGTANFSLTKGSGSTAGTPVYLCFKVTAGSGLAQGQTGSVTWAFTATSS